MIIDEDKIESRESIEKHLLDLKITQEELILKKFYLNEYLGIHLNTFPEDIHFVWRKMLESDLFRPKDYNPDDADIDIHNMKEEQHA